MKKIERIVLFGDSFIQGTGCFRKIEPSGKMIYDDNLDNRNPDLIEFQNIESWEKNLKIYFPNIEVLNYGRDGYSNYESFKRLNQYFKKDFRKTDLILFGFTSKYRDFNKAQQFVWSLYPNLLVDDNPLLHNPLAWEKDDYYLNRNYFASNGYNDYEVSKEEVELSKKFILDYTNYIHDDSHLNYIANTNYVFLQHWVETYNLNFHCFDLFENYVYGNIGNFEINKNIYINYNNHRNQSMLYYLIEQEKENPVEYQYTDFQVSYFEANNSFEGVEIVRNKNLPHPNQFGYKKYVEHLCETLLTKIYRMYDI